MEPLEKAIHYYTVSCKWSWQKFWPLVDSCKPCGYFRCLRGKRAKREWGLDWTHTFDNWESVVILKCALTFLQSFLGYSLTLSRPRGSPLTSKMVWR